MSVKQGDGFGELFLGFAYYEGNGVVKDYVEASKWLEKAADKGLEDAKMLLQEIKKK